MLTKLLQYAPVQMISALGVFLLIAIQTKFLDIAVYGMLAIFFLVTEVVRSFSAQWVNASIMRLYPAENQANQSNYRTVAIYLLVALFVPATGIVAMAIFYFDAFTWSVFLYLLILLFSKTAYLFLSGMSRLNDRTNAFRLATLLQAATALLLTYFLLDYNAHIGNALLALIISYVLALPVLFFKFKLGYIGNLKPFLSSIVSYGLPLMLSGTLASFSSRVDRLFIADTLGLAATGVYAALSNMLLGIMGLVFMVVAMSLYPELTKVVNDKAKLAVLHAKYFDTLMLVSLPAFVGLCLIAEPMISVFLTTDYLQHGINLFYILALSFFILNLRGHYIDHGLQFTLNTHLLPFIMGVSVFINIILLFVLLEQYGIYGAAMASLITNIITLLISFIVARHKGYRFQVSKDVLKVIIASIVMAFSMLLIRSELHDYRAYLQLIILIACGALIYFSTYILLNKTTFCRFISKASSK